MRFSEKLFPTILIVLDVCAALRYVPGGMCRAVTGGRSCIGCAPRCLLLLLLIREGM